jgi:predicted DNA-binding transcriptional regulator AlpA
MIQQTKQDQSTSTPAMYRLKEAAYYLQVSLPTLWRLGETDPRFPKKIHITSRCAGYLKDDLDKWLSEKGK